MTRETACTRLQAQVQELWPGAVVELTEYNEFVIRRGITAGTWHGWPFWWVGVVLGSSYPAAKAEIERKIREKKSAHA